MFSTNIRMQSALLHFAVIANEILMRFGFVTNDTGIALAGLCKFLLEALKLENLMFVNKLSWFIMLFD